MHHSGVHHGGTQGRIQCLRTPRWFTQGRIQCLHTHHGGVTKEEFIAMVLYLRECGVHHSGVPKVDFIHCVHRGTVFHWWNLFILYTMVVYPR